MGKGGGGGGAPQQTTATQYSTNIPEYAKPYVMNMLNAAQAQVYNPDMTGFREYKPYSANPQDYFAGPSGLQQASYNEAASMQTPGQFNLATGLGGIAGMGQLGAGSQYQQMATDPRSVQQYMSPYMQNAVDTQKMAAVRDYEKAMPSLAAQASRQGAFGGSRSAIERAEAQRTLFGRLGEIQAQGTQKAFEDAQQAQQFGANLGLQGLSGASQTAGMLGQLGGAQQQADISRLGLQNQLGGQQQQYQQGIINQAIQDYATQQQYPMIQLANMSNLLRGLPMQSGSTQMYQAAPSAISQLGGLGATALGVYGASGGFKAAQGGEVKSYAGGGVVGGVEAQLMQMDISQLQQVAKTSPSVSIREKAAEIIAEKQMAMQTKRSIGIDTLPAGNLDDIGMAGGGIVAFNGESGSYVDPDEARKRRQTEMWQRVKPDNKPYLAEDFREDAARFLDPIKGFLTMRGPRELERAKQLQTADQPGDYEMYTPKAVNYAATADTTSGAGTSGAGTSGAGKGRTEGASGAGGKYNERIEKLFADIEGKSPTSGLAQKDLDALREEMRDSKDQNLWMSLIQGGAKAMQSTSPHAMVGLGAGIEEGARTYGKGLEGERADKKLLLAQQSALEQAEYARKSGNLNALIAAQTRLDNVNLQTMALSLQKQGITDSRLQTAITARAKLILGDNAMPTPSQVDSAIEAATLQVTGKGAPASQTLPEGIKVTKIGK